jgi:hypothetical protein
MRKMRKTVAAKLLVAFMVGLLSSGQYAYAAAIGASTTPKERVNSISKGMKLDLVDKGVKQFEAFGTATAQLVVDEAGTAPTNGALVSIEVSTGPLDGSCYAIVFDSAAASNLDNSTSGRAIIPPVVANATFTTIVEFMYPKQFHRGLVLKTSLAGCRATIGWRRNGGTD